MRRTFPEIEREIGARIRTARLRRRMNQTELGEALRITFQQVQKYENGSNRLSASSLLVIARALCVPVDHLLGTDEAPHAIAPLPALDPVDAHLLAAARRLNPDHRRALTAFLHTFGNSLELVTDREAA